MKCIEDRKANTSLLRKVAERVGREFESLSFEELNERDESMGSVECDGHVVRYSAFSYDHDPASGTIFFCIDIHSKLPVWPPGRYPSWQFAMRPDGTVERT
ncbi:MAG: hypothetical protein HKN37_07370 [Rhodothermales bacterium]|nr:hypothetical protein [Rhodothermales bacterium]